jgi:riboflavin kinase/FMN adenylyltransferase
MHSATIGGFDGVHLAHQELIKRADFVIVIEKFPTLTPGFDRFEYIKKPIEFFKLDKIKNKTPLEFIEILKNLNVQKIIIGEDFKFGKDRKGNISLLKKYFEVEVIKEIKYQNIPIHSKIIRDLISINKINLANAMLGKHYKIKGIQIKGQGLGKKELVPTINITPFKPYTLPNGVFITKTNNYPSITFIGTRSTDNKFAIETHILKDNFKIDNLTTIEFLQFIRKNQPFKSTSQLKRAIFKDIAKAITFFKEKKWL